MVWGAGAGAGGRRLLAADGAGDAATSANNCFRRVESSAKRPLHKLKIAPIWRKKAI